MTPGCLRKNFCKAFHIAVPFFRICTYNLQCIYLFIQSGYKEKEIILGSRLVNKQFVACFSHGHMQLVTKRSCISISKASSGI